MDKNEDGLLRVVDYKSYAKEVEGKKLADGVQIQLFAYAYGLKKQPGVRVDDVGYIGIYLPTKKSDKGKKPELFEYLSAGKKKYDIEPMIEYAGQKLEQTCEKIAQGKGAAKLTASEYVEACRFCSFKGACGRLLNSDDKPSADEVKALDSSWKKGK